MGFHVGRDRMGSRGDGIVGCVRGKDRGLGDLKRSRRGGRGGVWARHGGLVLKDSWLPNKRMKFRRACTWGEVKVRKIQSPNDIVVRRRSMDFFFLPKFGDSRRSNHDSIRVTGNSRTVIGTRVLAIRQRKADGLRRMNVNLGRRCLGRREEGRVGGLKEEDHSGTEWYKVGGNVKAL
jgi:hypothetical protein